MMRRLKWILGILMLVVVSAIVIGWQSDRDPIEMKAKYANGNSRFINLGNDLSVHVRDEGKAGAPPILLIHGSNSSLQTWEPWVSRLGGKYRIISLDLPGHGLTGPNPSRDYSSAAFVDVVDQVMTKLEVQKFVIAGNSMGGAVAWHYTLKHPDKILALGLIDAGGAPQGLAKSLPIGFKLARMPLVRDLMRHITPRSVVAKSLRQSVSNQAIVTDAMIDRYWDLLLYPGNRQATLDRFAMSATNEPVSKAPLASIKAPTLILWGEEDSLIPVSSAQWFAAGISGSKTILYPKIGHVPMEEIPDKSAQDFDAFLTSALAK